MRIVFCGNPEFALPALKSLLASSHEVVAVVTSPDAPQGRGRKLAPMPVKEFSDAQGLLTLTPAKLKDSAFLERIRGLNPDALVVAAFRILPTELLAIPKFGALNIHPSLLPKGRGPAPIQWTLLRGETETGVTVIRLTEEIDGGGMLAQERTELGPNEHFGSLHDRLAEIGARMMLDVLDSIESGNMPEPIPQDESQVTKAPKLRAQDYEIDWARPQEEVLYKIRAFSPLPGALARFGESGWKITEAKSSSKNLSLNPGEVVVYSESILVGTGSGPIQLIRVRPAGKKEMAVADFLRGRPDLPAKFESKQNN